MAEYTAAHRYSSKRDGQEFGHWAVGSKVELSEADAEWVNRDSPGALIPGYQQEAEAAAPEPEPESEPEPEPKPEPAPEPEPEPEEAERQAAPKPNRQARKVRDRSL